MIITVLDTFKQLHNDTKLCAADIANAFEYLVRVVIIVYQVIQVVLTQSQQKHRVNACCHHLHSLSHLQFVIQYTSKSVYCVCCL